MAGAPPYPDAAIRSRRRYTNAAVTFAVTDQSSKFSAQLAAGNIYSVYATCEWHFRQAPSTDSAATTGYMLLEPYEKVQEMYVSDTAAGGDSYVTGIASSGNSGTVYIVRVS